jgi:hypothetical protein
VRVEHLDQDVIYFLPFHFDLFSRFRPMVSQHLRSPGCVALQADVFNGDSALRCGITRDYASVKSNGAPLSSGRKRALSLDLA